jgi:hypothetical protein
MIFENLARYFHSMPPKGALREIDRAEVIVRDMLNTWIESVRFAYEVQGVISMRLSRLAQGGPQAAVEVHRMIAEKFDAFADAEAAISKALADGEGVMVAAGRAYAPVSRRVHANSRRLLRAMA